MSNFIIRKTSDRITRPQDRPDYQRALAVGEKRLATGKMSFESEGQRRDYMRSVSANPNNVPGLPAFFPPEQVRSFVAMQAQEISPLEKFLNKVDNESVKSIYLYCQSCRGPRESSSSARVTEHSISKTDCFCKTCGASKKYRIGTRSL
jgi:hypothetical protein